MRIKYVVAFHFDGNTALSYHDTPARRHKTVDRPEWWAQRIKIMQQYVIPSLRGQTFQDFTVWGLFMRGYEDQSKGMRKLFKSNGFNITFDGPAQIREVFRDKVDWLGWIHNDSDDLYARGAFARFAKHEPAEGRVVYCPCGYAYDVNDRSRPVALIGKKTSPPPSFYMAFYPNSSLQSEPHWYGYRRRYRMNVRHFKMNNVARPVREIARCYCILMHGGNTVSQWKTLRGRHAGVVPPNERANVLLRFGVKE